MAERLSEEEKQLIYDYKHAYAEGNIQKGRQILEQITTDKRFEKLFRSVVWDAQYYVMRCPSELCHRIKSKHEDYPYAINPFIIQDERTRNFIMGVRQTNYASCDGVQPMVRVHQVKTLYQIYIYDRHFEEMLSTFPLQYSDEALQSINKYPKQFFATGIEDFRMIYEGEDMLTGTCVGMETHEQPIRISQIKMKIIRSISSSFDNDCKIIGLVVCKVSPYKGYGEQSPQKNWLPLPKRPLKKGKIMYSCSPCIIIKPTTKECEKFWSYEMIQSKKIENSLYQCRNGTPPIEYHWNGIYGYLTIAHVSADHQTQISGIMHHTRVYYHRLLFYTPNFALFSYSNLFYFDKAHTVEFASSMVYDEEANVFYIGLGFRDRMVHIHKIHTDMIDSMLHTIRN